MSAQTSKRDDVMQIMIFTFFLCALFFGAWGFYNRHEMKTLRVRRGVEHKYVGDLEKDFANRDNRQNLVAHRRRVKLQEDRGEGLRGILVDVAGKLPGGHRIEFGKGQNGNPRESNNVVEIDHSTSLADAKLESIIRFIGQLEVDRPDIHITDLDLERKRKRGDATAIEDVWTTDNFKVSTYVTKDEKEETE